jgi:hypothetical protein
VGQGGSGWMCIFHNIEGPEQGSKLKVERRFTSSEGCESG